MWPADPVPKFTFFIHAAWTELSQKDKEKRGFGLYYICIWMIEITDYSPASKAAEIVWVVVQAEMPMICYKDLNAHLQYRD